MSIVDISCSLRTIHWYMCSRSSSLSSNQTLVVNRENEIWTALAPQLITRRPNVNARYAYDADGLSTNKSVAFDDTPAVQLFGARSINTTGINGKNEKIAISYPHNFYTTRLNIKARLRQAIVRYNSCSGDQEKLIIVIFKTSERGL